MSLIAAFKKDEELLLEIKSAPHDDSLHIWWLGQSGYLLHVNGTYFLTDPYLSDSLTLKYAGTDKPHVRMSEKVLDPDTLHFIDFVSSSHNHTDHLDADTLIPILKNNPGIKFIIPEANRSFVATRCQCPIDFPVGLDDRSMHSFGHVSIHGIPAAHETVDRNEAWQPIYMGYIIYINQYCIYHSGDCIPFPGLEEILKKYHIDIAFLPVNGRAPERKVSGNFTIQEACDLAKAVQVKMVIPCHYDMFEFNTVNVNDLPRYAESIHQQYKILSHGELFTYQKARS